MMRSQFDGRFRADDERNVKADARSMRAGL